jgi:putative ABC transport system ATP-binding protein
MSVLELTNVSKSFGEGTAAVHALARVTLSVEPGAMMAVMGPSGAGKSARLRRRAIGYFFQDYNLLPGLTAAENVSLPLELDGVPARRARAAGMAALEQLGLAVVGDRRLLLADEPSGALDSANGEAVMDLVRAACDRGVAALVVTHDAHLAARANRIVSIKDGHLVSQAGRMSVPRWDVPAEEDR